MDREREQIPVAEALADANGLCRGLACGGKVARGLVLEHEREEQVAALGALALVLEDPLRAAEPAGSRTDAAAACEIQADPDCAARGTPRLSGLQEPLVRTFEPGDRVVVATEHEGADREEIEVFRGEALPLLHHRQRLVRLAPCAPRIGLPASLELLDSIPHAAAHCPANDSGLTETTSSPTNDLHSPKPGHDRGAAGRSRMGKPRICGAFLQQAR